MSLEAVYGAWLFATVVSVFLFGGGINQAWLYMVWWPADSWSYKLTVLFIVVFETAQVSFCFVSLHIRFVKNFGKPLDGLLWSDSIQLLGVYFSAFLEQTFFARRIHQLVIGTRHKLYSLGVYKLYSLGVYVAFILSFLQLSMGIAQVVLSYETLSFAKHAKIVTLVQTLSSFLCDVVITTYLCLFLERNKQVMWRGEAMMNVLISHAINRGVMTATISALTVVLFIVFPDSFWFLITLCPGGQLYLITLLANLNARSYVRSLDIDPNAVDLDNLPARRNTVPATTSAVNIENLPNQVYTAPFPAKAMTYPSSETMV
ncbi:hypothetical protein B0H11DRAFT_2229130 [Mycena galericulata]|nr:hypothetical protein B0H11DRAFT_2229130 [Mycena galericulata]